LLQFHALVNVTVKMNGDVTGEMMSNASPMNETRPNES
jgi:hypothetical protein